MLNVAVDLALEVLKDQETDPPYHDLDVFVDKEQFPPLSRGVHVTQEEGLLLGISSGRPAQNKKRRRRTPT